jgi:hypothetical protein
VADETRRLLLVAPDLGVARRHRLGQWAAAEHHRPQDRRVRADLRVRAPGLPADEVQVAAGDLGGEPVVTQRQRDPDVLGPVRVEGRVQGEGQRVDGQGGAGRRGDPAAPPGLASSITTGRRAAPRSVSS